MYIQNGRAFLYTEYICNTRAKSIDFLTSAQSAMPLSRWHIVGNDVCFQLVQQNRRLFPPNKSQKLIYKRNELIQAEMFGWKPKMRSIWMAPWNYILRINSEQIKILTGAGSRLVDAVVAFVFAVAPAIHRQTKCSLSVFARAPELRDVASVDLGWRQERRRR